MTAGEAGAAIRLRLAGVFSAERAGASIDRDIGGGKSALLLKVLAAARGQLVPMDTLIDVLWGDDPPQKAEANVATLVSRLRRVLGTEAIDGGRSGYRVLPGPALTIDVDEAEAFAVEAEGRLAADQPALALTASRAALDLLGSGRLFDEHAGAEWAVEVSRDSARLLRRARAAGWRAATALGDHRAALEWAQDAISADELDEDAHRVVIAAYHRLGESGEALRSYERLRTTLLEQLGADPGAETAALYEAVLRGEALPEDVARGADATATATATAVRRGFVGRDGELTRLIAAWSRASRGSAGCALIRGEPGIGKTRLAVELAEHAAATGALVLQARCYEAERSLFLQPVVELVRSAVTGLPSDLVAKAADRPGPLTSLIPDLEPVLGPVAYEHAAGEIERRRTFEAVASFFAGLARRRPLLLVVDDLDNAGASTVEMLHFTRRWDPAAPLLIVATARGSEATSRVAAIEPLAECIELGPLPEPAVRALAREAGSPDQADAVVRMTRGHTLFVVEALRALADAKGAGGAAATAPGAFPVPESLRAAVETRVAGCGEDVEAFLRAAVVAGSPFELSWVADLLSADLEGVATRAERARKAGILVDAGSTYEFANDLIRDVLYDTTPAPVRAMRHQRLATLLATRPAAAAPHAAAAGDWSSAARLWLDAGKRALASLATREAEQLFTKALDASVFIDDPAVTAATHLARGRARAMLGEYAKGAEDLTAAHQLARAIGATSIEAEAMVELGWCAYWGRDLSRATEIAERVGANAAAGAAGQILFAKMRHTAGDLRVAGERLQAVTAAEMDPADRAMAVAALAKVFVHYDDYTTAVPLIDEAVTACRHSGLLRSMLGMRMVGILARGNLGDFAGALAAAESLLADVERYELAVYRPRALNMLAWMWRELGELERARDLATAALEACEPETGVIEGEPAANSLLALAESALLDGDDADAAHHLAGIDRLSGSVGYRWRIDLRRVEVLCRMDRGAGEELLDAARKYGSAKYEALGLHHLGRSDLAVEVARRTGSPWLLARVAPEQLARRSFDQLAGQLPPDLRAGFVARGPLARHLTLS